MNPFSVILGVAAIVVVILEMTGPFREHRRVQRAYDSLRADDASRS